MHVGAGYSAELKWRAIDTAFKNCILTGAVIKSKYIESYQFPENASEIVLDHVRDVLQEHDALKINTVFNGEFVAGDKYANKNVSTRNCELFCSSDL